MDRLNLLAAFRDLVWRARPAWRRVGAEVRGMHVPDGYAGSGLRPVGYSELDGRPGFKISIRQHADRWYLYLGHCWHSGWSIVDVTDAANPRVVRSSAGPTEHGNSEGAAEHAREGLDHASVIDIRRPDELRLLGAFPRPVPAAGAPYRDFADRSGWSGPHNQNQLQHNPLVEPHDDLVYLTYFNAGLQVYDVSEPRRSVETAWLLPPDPVRRYGSQPPSGLVVQTEDVLAVAAGTSGGNHGRSSLIAALAPGATEPRWGAAPLHGESWTHNSAVALCAVPGRSCAGATEGAPCLVCRCC